MKVLKLIKSSVKSSLGIEILVTGVQIFINKRVEYSLLVREEFSNSVIARRLFINIDNHILQKEKITNGRKFLTKDKQMLADFILTDICFRRNSITNKGSLLLHEEKTLSGGFLLIKSGIEIIEPYLESVCYVSAFLRDGSDFHWMWMPCRGRYREQGTFFVHMINEIR